MLTLPKNAPPAFHLLAKPTGAIYNLDCQYCFFLTKEQLYPGSKFRMTDDLLETYIQQLLESHQTPEVTVAWQGGEPTLMGLEFFQRSIELVEIYKKPGQQVTHTLQQRQFGQAKSDTLPQYCLDCKVRFACNGGCPKNRFIETPDGEPGLNYLCAGYKAFFTHIDQPMQMMATLLRQGRYADEVMLLLAPEEIAKKERHSRKPIGFGKTTPH